MDQAASVVSESSSALYITFHPELAVERVPVPASTNPDFNPVFIIANSMVTSDKAASAKTGYNLRVVETLVAARILAKHLGIDVGPKEKITFREVVDRHIHRADGVGVSPPILKEGLQKVLQELEVLKPKGKPDGEYGLTMEEMVLASGLTESHFNELYLSWVEGQLSVEITERRVLIYT